MIKPQPSLMEVTRTLSNCASAAQFDFGEDTAIVAVQHMLWQTIDLFEAAAALGAKRENIFALGKIYSNSPLVIGALRDRGITVVQSTTPEPGEFDKYFQHDVDHLWEVVARSIANRDIKRILVLDDGGRCITSIPPELLRQYAVSGVEQTSRGTFLFEEKPPPFAVMSWARAAVKLQIGGPLFSHCLLVKLQSRVLGGNRLTGDNVGIIGMGSIGTAMAHLIARQHNNVSFYDPDPSLHVSPYVQGRAQRVDSLEELLSRCEYVVGCSGVSRLSLQLRFSRHRSSPDRRGASRDWRPARRFDSGAHSLGLVRGRTREEPRHSSYLAGSTALCLRNVAHGNEESWHRPGASLRL
ncbi:MAG: NAD(P)-dependent oxidoreductase [Thermoanaerobaculia bacterium]